MNNKVVIYISRNGNLVETRTLRMSNATQHMELLALLHDIANGMESNTRITITNEV